MGEIIGRMTCPVCGAPNQNLKINKNGNLYSYCDNRCSVRFNAKESRELIDELRHGRTVRKGGAVYVPIGAPAPVKIEEKTKKTQPAKVLALTEEKTKNDGKQRRNTTDGRPDGESAGNSGNGQQRPVERFAAWLWGDDDIA